MRDAGGRWLPSRCCASASTSACVRASPNAGGRPACGRRWAAACRSGRGRSGRRRRSLCTGRHFRAQSARAPASRVRSGVERAPISCQPRVAEAGVGAEQAGDARGGAGERGRLRFVQQRGHLDRPRRVRPRLGSSARGSELGSAGRPLATSGHAALVAASSLATGALGALQCAAEGDQVFAAQPLGGRVRRGDLRRRLASEPMRAAQGAESAAPRTTPAAARAEDRRCSAPTCRAGRRRRRALVRRDRGRSAFGPVCERRRDDQLAPSTDLHAGHALVPAGDHLSLAEGEAERFVALPGRVEFLAAVIQHAHVVDRDRCPRTLLRRPSRR